MKGKAIAVEVAEEAVRNFQLAFAELIPTPKTTQQGVDQNQLKLLTSSIDTLRLYFEQLADTATVSADVKVQLQKEKNELRKTLETQDAFIKECMKRLDSWQAMLQNLPAPQ